MKTPWAQPPKTVALTGSALSREAGFAPFAADRMPAGLRLEDVVTREGFARDPVRVQDFYNLRQCRASTPAYRLGRRKALAHRQRLPGARPRLALSGDRRRLRQRAGPE